MDIWKTGTTKSADIMALVRMLYFCAARYNIHVVVTHIAGVNNSIADTLSLSGHPFPTASPTCSTSTGHHPCMASPILEGLLSHYQSLGVATSTRRTYQAGVRAFQQFCYQYGIPSIPASPLTLRYFCCSIAQRVSHKTIKVYLTRIRLEHLERGCQDPTNDELLLLLCKGIKRSQGTTRRTRLPITINILRTLKTKLREESSYSLLEKRLLWSAFTLAFYGFLRASEFATPDLSWSNVQLNPNKVVVFIQQSKTDPFCNGHTITICSTDTSTCPVRAITQYVLCVAHCSLYAAHVLCVACCSLLIGCCSCAVCCVLLIAHCMLLMCCTLRVAHCSLYVAHCSL